MSKELGFLYLFVILFSIPFFIFLNSLRSVPLCLSCCLRISLQCYSGPWRSCMASRFQVFRFICFLDFMLVYSSKYWLHTQITRLHLYLEEDWLKIWLRLQFMFLYTSFVCHYRIWSSVLSLLCFFARHAFESRWNVIESNGL